MSGAATDATRFLTLPDARRIAYRCAAGAEPALVFLPGYRSDMAGGKAQAVWRWARATGRGCLLFDYSGCGESPGDFAQGTLSRWAGEAQALIAACALTRVVLVGSSMGGWLMLLLARALGPRAAALVGIAAAPDFTRWGMAAADRAALAAGSTVWADNPYGADRTPTYPAFWRDAERQCLLDRVIDYPGPVRLLHGQRDADVPWEIALRLAAALGSDAVQLTLVKDGDHRLSREDDIALLLETLAALPVWRAAA